MNAKNPIPVTHIITGLNTGGAETMLLHLLGSIDRSKFPSRVISLTNIGSVGNQIAAMGIPVFAGKMKTSAPSSMAFFNIVDEIRKNSPGVVQTWMYHADLIGGLAAKFAGNPPVVWGIHNSTLDPQKSKISTRFVVRINAFLSGLVPKKIIVCSQAARLVHLQAGYCRDRMVFVPNGFDLSVFKPNPQARLAIRRELGIDESCWVTGMAARFDPQKDYATFFGAAAELMEKFTNLHIVLCGDGISQENTDLMKLVFPLNAQNRIHLLGRRSDMPDVLASWDVAVLSSSFGEAFPLVIGEAMACEVPCVGTDVGDTADLIGKTGEVVPSGNPHLLAEAVVRILSRSRSAQKDLGKAARKQIQLNYEIGSIAERYQQIWVEVATK
jgi:glycosyltransferase involved in cell wall biosynthesis